MIELANEVKEEGQLKSSILVKGCKHYLSTPKDLRKNISNDLLEIEEFSCPMCNKACNCFIPKFSKTLRESLILKSNDPSSQSQMDLRWLLEKITSNLNEEELLSTLHTQSTYPEESIKKVKQEKKASEDFINEVIDFNTRFKNYQEISSTEINVEEAFESWGDTFLLLNTISFANFIKLFGSSMDSLYLCLRLAVIDNYSKLGELGKKRRTRNLERLGGSSRSELVKPLGKLRDWLPILANATQKDEDLLRLSITHTFCSIANLFVDPLD